MAQRVKELPTKPKDLGLIPRPHTVEGESQLSSDLHIHVLTCVCSTPHTHKYTTRLLKIKISVEYGEIRGPSIPKYHMIYTPGKQRLKAGVPLAVCPQASALQVNHRGH